LIGSVSQGIPRIVNNICDNALLYGYAAGASVITRDIIEEVIESLDLAPSGRTNHSSVFCDKASSGQ
jgi:hypothetical protein